MVVQAVQGGKLLAAEVALVAAAVPRALCSDSLDVFVVARHREHGPCDDVVAVELVHDVVDLEAVETGDADPGFKMDGYA